MLFFRRTAETMRAMREKLVLLGTLVNIWISRKHFFLTYEPWKKLDASRTFVAYEYVSLNIRRGDARETRDSRREVEKIRAVMLAEPVYAARQYEFLSCREGQQKLRDLNLICKVCRAKQ